MPRHNEKLEVVIIKNGILIFGHLFFKKKFLFLTLVRVLEHLGDFQNLKMLYCNMQLSMFFLYFTHFNNVITKHFLKIWCIARGEFIHWIYTLNLNTEFIVQKHLKKVDTEFIFEKHLKKVDTEFIVEKHLKKVDTEFNGNFQLHHRYFFSKVFHWNILYLILFSGKKLGVF